MLDNLTQDQTGVKETATMRFYTRLGIPAPRETHTRLYVNGSVRGALRPGRIRRQDHDGPRVRQHRRRRAERRLPVRIQLRARQPVAIHLRRLGARRRTRCASTSRPTRATPSPRSGDRSRSWCAWSTTPSSGGIEQTIADRLDLPAFVRYIAAQNFVARHDGFNGYDGMNNFYHLPARKTARSTSSSPGTRTTPSCSPISRSRCASTRTC